MSVRTLRVVVAALLAGIVVTAAVPLLVLLSLASGGDGYGLCRQGITSCRVPYTAAPELSFGLVVALFAMVAALRVTMRTIRRVERRQPHRSGAGLPK